MKKMENTRSHSWWWDSHICPKSSKWLQENLTEMDSKVSAMLRIIEEDADSFAQRAEMYYKKRPELINLVEEFYRTYRALVERYTYLTREIRQNIAPALQAQLGVSTESAQNSPVDLHLKRGIDGPDIISPSYSYTGASEFDYDSPSEVSTKGQTDDEFSPLGFRTNYERRAFGFKPRFPNSEESSQKTSESGGSHGTVDVDIGQLQKELLRLQEENKELAFKSTEDISKQKNLQLELSSLQFKVRSLEAEEKLTKKRLMSVQEKEQKLEAENLKLSHALISSKEERTDLLEQQKKVVEDSKVAEKKIALLEDEREGLKLEVLTVKSQQLEGSENLKKSEEAVQKLQLSLTALEEERLKDSFLMEIYEQQSQELLNKISDIERKNASVTDEVSMQAAEIQNLQKQLADALENTQLLEQTLYTTSQERAYTEQEKSLVASQVKDLQKVMERTQKEREQQASDIARLKGIIQNLEEEGLRVQSEKLESAKYVCELETSIEVGQQSIETLLASCQQYEDRCKAVEVKYDESKERLLSSSQEMSRLQQTLEDMVTSSQLQSEEFQKKVSSLVVEKSSLMDELQKKVEIVRSAEVQCAEMQDIIQDQKEEIEGLQKELENQFDKVRQLEEDFSLVYKEKSDLMEKEAEAFTLLKCEHIQLKQQVDLNLTLTQDLTNKLSCSEVEKTELALEIQQMQQSVLELQTVNTVMSGDCLESKKGLEAAEAAARKAKKELALSLSQVEKLQEESHAKGELLSKMMSDVETLEAQIARYREENSSLGKEYTGNLAALGAQNNDLNSRLSGLVNLNTALAKQVCEKERSIEQLTDELAAAQRQVAALREDIELKTSQALDLQQEMSTVEKQMELVHTELLECSLIKESLEAVVEELQNDNSKTKEALVCEQQRLLNDVLLLKSINQDLEATISHLKREKASLQEEAITHSTQCNDLKQRIVSLETDYEAVLKERITLQSQIAELEDENAKKLFEAEGRVQDLQLKLSNMLAEEASLAEQMAERIGHIHTLDTALFDLQKDNTILSEEIGRLQQQASSYRTREASLLSEMHESSDFIQALSTEIEKLKRVVLNAEETERRFFVEQHKALEECALLQQKIETLHQDLEISWEEKAIFLTDIASHSGRSSELECEVRRLEAEKDCLQQELLRAQQAEHYLKEDVGKLEEERQRLSGTLDLQGDKIEELQFELNCSKDVTDKMNLLAEEKTVLLQKLKEREQELEEARQNCLKVQSALQQLTSSSNIEMGNKMEEVRVLQQNSLIWQAAKFKLEQKLELWSRQALTKEDKEKTLAEMLAAAQQEISKLELHLVDAQRRVIETNEECEALKAAVGVGTAKKELEQELQEDNKSTCYLKMQQELRWLQDQKDRSDSELEAAVLQGHEYSSKLSSLQEQLLSAENLKLEMAEQYSKLTEEWGAAERKMQEEILQLRLASFQEKNELKLQHKRVLELEDEVCQFQAEKKALLSDNACIENQKMDLQLQLADLKSHLAEKQEDYSKVSAQAELLLEGVSLNENINLELQKQVQLLREENQELMQKLQSNDGELAQLKAYLEILEGGLLELQERIHESQRESKLKEVTCQVQAEENVLFKEQNRELTRAVSKVREEYTNLETKLAAEAAALDVVKHELFLLKEEKGEGQLAKVRETSLCASRDHSQQYFQLISKMEDVEKMLYSVLNIKQSSVKDLPFQKKQVDLHQTVPSLLQTISTEVLADRDSMIQEGSSSSSETMTHDQEVREFDAMVNAVDRLKKSIFILLNGSHQAEVISSIEEQQEQVSCLQEEIGHLNLEVKLYQEDICHLKKILQGEKFQEEGEVAHSDVRGLQAMLYNLQGSLVILEEKVKGLKEEVNLESEQKRSLQLTLTDLQVEGLPYVLLLRNKLLLSCKGLRLLVHEWNKKGCNKESNQIKECLEKLSRAEALCNSSDIQDEERRGIEGEEHLQLGASQSTGASTFLLEQLKKRVEECSLLCEAVEDMLLPTYWQDQCKDKQEQGLGSTSNESKDSSPMEENHDTLLHPKQQGLGSTSKESKHSSPMEENHSPMEENHDALLHPDQQVSTEHIGSEIEVDIEGGIVDNVSEGSMHDETEILRSSEKKEIDLIEGLAQLHINLGMRLHQALMDEKLENELQELKEEREKLKDDLQARVEQVQSMEAELEKLQVILKEGREGDQQKQWLQHKKRAEKRARKLSRELVLQRQHVGNLQDAVVAWTQQQELATQMLEKQVLSLVSQECSPTMEGWDAAQVSYLMQEMQSRKALTRRHSMDLQSVGQELQRVGSSIETTQRKLLKKEEEEQEANQARESVSPDVIMNHHKFGLTWLLLLFTTGRRSFLKQSSKDTLSATKASPKQVLLHRTSTSTLLSSLLAHTRKMRCCACAPRCDQPESLDAR